MRLHAFCRNALMPFAFAGLARCGESPLFIRARSLRRTAVAFTALCICLSAQAWSSPQEAIERFLKFELNGGRLQSWPVQKYFSVDSTYEEPGWDLIHVVQSYRIGAVSCSGQRCTIKVSFVYAPTSGLSFEQVVPHPTGGTESVEYIAIQAGNSWLLRPPGGQPRVIYDEAKRRLAGEVQPLR